MSRTKIDAGGETGEIPEHASHRWSKYLLVSCRNESFG